MIFALAGFSGCGNKVDSENHPDGEEKKVKTKILEAGAFILQRDAPLDAINVYLVGFHPIKEQPDHQIEAHHFCHQVNEDFAQCVLFDGNTSNANMTGIEYIISERLFKTLPNQERQYWHPHNHEILSGQLIAPGLPSLAENELMETKINSYGKTWHLWNTGSTEENPDRLPFGEPRLAWSFNREGEINPDLLQQRDEQMDTDTEDIQQSRRNLIPLARPQTGVNAIQHFFGDTTRSIDGVEEEND